jgi:hypothetical protein
MLEERGIGQLLMKTLFGHAVLPWIVVLAIVPISALAEDKPSHEAIDEVTLDIDHDGNADRAVLVEPPDRPGADLYIYLAVGNEKLDLSRKPTFLKKDLTGGAISTLESNGKGSLMVRYGCGGCSNDNETTLTIVSRGGEFLVAGFTFDWDTRYSAGTCDINFLTGKGTISEGAGVTERIVKRFVGKFTPVKLSDWSDDNRPKACEF